MSQLPVALAIGDEVTGIAKHRDWLKARRVTGKVEFVCHLSRQIRVREAGHPALWCDAADFRKVAK